MIFTTWPFALFMAVVFAGYWWAVPARGRHLFLLLASLAFFTYAFPPHTLLLGGLAAVVYALAHVTAACRHAGQGVRARWALAAGLVLSVGVLAAFKYSGMFAGAWNAMASQWAPSAEVSVPRLLVPLGISFFTFEFVHYLTDVYAGRTRRGSFLEFSLFAFFFPSLVSGPIKRFQIFQEQMRSPTPLDPSYVAEGLRRITVGVAKKVVVADTASLLVRPLTYPEAYPTSMLWLAMYAYAVKIYYDFAGYTDIAIGCALLLGYRLPENFNRPYRQSNLSRFWNNWHMSLSSWIRDYLFIPLGGSRAGWLRTAANLTLVMAICGLWHGANWNFVVWGLWHGLGLAALRAYRWVGRHVPDVRPVRWAGVAATFHFVCIGWVLFASPGLPHALLTLKRMLMLG